jgi:hypothetical protein
MNDVERPKETARKKATRKWANHDLTRRYKESKAMHNEMEPPKQAVVTIENPHFEKQRRLQKLIDKNRQVFVDHMRSLINEGRQRTIIHHQLSNQELIRKCKIAKLKLLLKAKREQEASESALAQSSST